MVIKKAVLVSVVTFALLFQTGCSFLFVKGPPEKHAEMDSFDCSESNAWPVLDLIWAGLNGLGAATAAGSEEMPNTEQTTDPNTVIAVGLSWLVVSGISSIYGFSKVSSCKEAKQRPFARNDETRGSVSAPVHPGTAPAGVPPGVAPATPATAPAAPATPATAPATPATAPAPASSPPGTAPSSAPAPAPAPPAAAPSPSPAAGPAAPTASLRLRLPTYLAAPPSTPRTLTMRSAH